MAEYVVSAVGTGPISVTRTSSRTRPDLAVAFPSLLAMCRPALLGWDRVGRGSASEVGTLVRDLIQTSRRKSEAGRKLEAIEQRLVQLTDEERVTRDPKRLATLPGEIRAAERDEAERQRTFRDLSERTHTLTVQLDGLIARHNSIIAALERGSYSTPIQRAGNSTSGGSSTSVDVGQAQLLAEESIRLVGPRLLVDDQPPPQPVIQPIKAPPSWSRPSLAAHLLTQRPEPRIEVDECHD